MGRRINTVDSFMQDSGAANINSTFHYWLIWFFPLMNVSEDILSQTPRGLCLKNGPKHKNVLNVGLIMCCWKTLFEILTTRISKQSTSSSCQPVFWGGGLNVHSEVLSLLAWKPYLVFPGFLNQKCCHCANSIFTSLRSFLVEYMTDEWCFSLRIQRLSNWSKVHDDSGTCGAWKRWLTYPLTKVTQHKSRRLESGGENDRHHSSKMILKLKKFHNDAFYQVFFEF